MVLPAVHFLGSEASAQSAEKRVEEAVVAIEVTSQRGDWFTPWQRSRPFQQTGSGFIITKGRVMTNAHVVSDARQIIVRRSGNSTPYFARVLYIAHDSDLALLAVDGEAFDAGVAPLRIGGLPSLRTRVRTYGFPAGGEKISRTEGVVSRIQFVNYVHSGADGHLAIQTDSAINPGNSGGPVLQDGMVIGVAFQVNTDLNDVGFFIPTTVINRFLADIRDGSYDGFGEMGIYRSNLINPAYRAFLKLPERLTGVVVDGTIPFSSSDKLLFQNDVIMAIDGQRIGNEGNIDYYGHALGFEQIAEEKQIGESVTLDVWRKGKPIQVKLTIKYLDGIERVRSRFDVLPKYFIYAGLVFMELEQEYMNTFGNFWENANQTLLYAHFYEEIETPEKASFTPVVLTRVLPHEVNRTYRKFANSLVTAVNGRPIRSLADIPAAFESQNGKYHVIRLQRGGPKIVLERKAADKAHAEILERYGVRQDRRLE